MVNQDFINDYIRSTLKPSTGLLKELEQFAKEQHVPIITPEVAQLLIVLGRLVKPVRIY